MKLQELFDKVMADDALKAQFAENAKNGTLLDFVKKQGCDVAEDELNAFIAEKSGEDVPLSLSDLENAAGGDCGTFGLINCHSSHRSACNDCR